MSADWILERSEYNYPIGLNGLWHGGIHIIPRISLPESERWIKQLFKGTVVAGKIQNEYYKQDYYGEKIEYSTSYALFEHSMKFKLDEQNGNSQYLDLNFYSLYMHLLPFSKYNGIEIKSFELPFYLSWEKITILPDKDELPTENDKLPAINKIMIDKKYPLYHGSIIEADEPEWFHPNNNHINKRNEITVKIKTKSDDDNNNTIITQKISKNYLTLSPLPRTVPIVPVKNSVPIYDSKSEDNQFYIGKITKECVISNRNDTDIMQKIKIGNQEPIEVPVGVVFDSINNNRILINDVALYIIPENEKTSTFAFFEPKKYIEQYKLILEKKIPKLSKNVIKQECDKEEEKIKGAQIFENRYIIVEYNIKFPSNTPTPTATSPAILYIDLDDKTVLSKLPNDFHVLIRADNKKYIAIPNNKIIHTEYTEFQGERTSLQSYHFKKKTIKKGLKLTENGSSVLPCYLNYKVNFSENTLEEIYTNLTYYKAKTPVSITVNANDSSSKESEEGIACYDKSGYIRNLLKHGSSFLPFSGSMEDGTRICINSVYTDKSIQRYIDYNKNLRLKGYSVLNDKKVEKNPVVTNQGSADKPTIYKLKKDEKVYAADILGRTGKFIGQEELCHLEVFMNTKDTQTINDLFSGKYILNAYTITSEIFIYEKDEDKTAGTENKSISVKQLANQNELPRPHTVYGYQLKRKNETDDYYSFEYDKKEYFIKKDDKEKIKENLLNFEKYFITKHGGDDSDDIFCDEKTKGIYKVLTKDELKKCVCKFPIEWDGSLYKRCTDRRCGECNRVFKGQCENLPQKMWTYNYGISNFPELSDMMKNADIRTDIDFLMERAKVCHFHPITFYKRYVELLKTQQINPYAGKEFGKRQWDLVVVLKEKLLEKVTSTPGFAPVWEEPYKDQNAYEGDKFDGFAVPTGYFNQEYFNFSTNTKYLHEGVDFRGRNNTEIISFINGRVIYAGWTNTTYGRVLIIADEKDDGIYLLGHLSGIVSGIKKGSLIEPYEKVAYVGGSAYENRIKNENYFDINLHVSYYDVQYTKEKDDNGFYGKLNDYNLYTFNNLNNNKVEIGYKKGTEKDPFNHK